MAEIDDLNAAVDALKAEVSSVVTQMDAEFAALQAALAANNGPAITQATANIQGMISTLQAAATRDVPPAPVVQAGPAA